MILFKTNWGNINEAMLKFLIKHKINVKVFSTINKILINS